MQDFNPTETLCFRNGTDLVLVHVQNDADQHAWQLEVNSNKSEPTKYYAGILTHNGFGYATAYWEGNLPIEVPFRIVPLERE